MRIAACPTGMQLGGVDKYHWSWFPFLPDSRFFPELRSFIALSFGDYFKLIWRIRSLRITGSITAASAFYGTSDTLEMDYTLPLWSGQFAPIISSESFLSGMAFPGPNTIDNKLLSQPTLGSEPNCRASVGTYPPLDNNVSLFSARISGTTGHNPHYDLFTIIEGLGLHGRYTTNLLDLLFPYRDCGISGTFLGVPLPQFYELDNGAFSEHFTGTIEITPSEWWEYRDANEQNPLYDKLTGEQLRPIPFGF